MSNSRAGLSLTVSSGSRKIASWGFLLTAFISSIALWNFTYSIENACCQSARDGAHGVGLSDAENALHQAP